MSNNVAVKLAPNKLGPIDEVCDVLLPSVPFHSQLKFLAPVPV